MDPRQPEKERNDARSQQTSRKTHSPTNLEGVPGQTADETTRQCRKGIVRAVHAGPVSAQLVHSRQHPGQDRQGEELWREMDGRQIWVRSRSPRRLPSYSIGPAHPCYISDACLVWYKEPLRPLCQSCGVRDSFMCGHCGVVIFAGYVSLSPRGNPTSKIPPTACPLCCGTSVFDSCFQINKYAASQRVGRDVIEKAVSARYPAGVCSKGVAGNKKSWIGAASTLIDSLSSAANHDRRTWLASSP